MPRSPIRLAASLLVVVAAGAPPAPAQSAAPNPPRLVGYVPMKDGIKLAYTAYLPADTGRFPAVFQYEPYVGAGSAPGNVGPNSQWLRNGYAVVFVNVRGSGCSQGRYDFFGPHEGPDGAEVIAWIGRQRWSDQTVGMIGGSYPGHTQILVAAQRPPLLQAITPAAITASTYDEVLYPGGIFNAGFASRWTLFHQPGAEAIGVKARTAWGDTECEANYRAHPPSTLLATLRARPTYDTWWQDRSLISYVDRVKVPALISGSWQDHQTAGSGGITIYDRLAGAKRLVMGPGGHGSTFLQGAFQDELIRWMDRWLKGIENGVEREPPVAVYWELGGSGKPGPSWISRHDAWPPRDAALRTLYLSGDGTLADVAPGDSGAAPRSRTYTYPVGTELIGNSAQFTTAPEPTGSLTWVSSPFPEDVTILGAIRATLFLSSDALDTDLAVDVNDIYPSGETQYLQRGFLRVSFRRADSTRSRPDRIWRSYHRKDPLVPGRVTEISLTLPEVGAVLRAGHRLQLVLAAPSPIPQPDWGPLPLDLPARNTIHSSARFPSAIRLPLIPGARAGGPEPVCGSQAYQPCRPAPRQNPGRP